MFYESHGLMYCWFHEVWFATDIVHASTGGLTGLSNWSCETADRGCDKPLAPVPIQLLPL